MGHDYWIVLKISGNERFGDETNIAAKIVFELRTLSTDFTSSGRLAGTGNGRATSPLHRLSLASTLTNFSPTHSRSDYRRSWHSPSQSHYRWCRRFEAQLYRRTRPRYYRSRWPA